MYDAVTFDTQTVRSNSFDFNGGLLKLLTKLRHDTIIVVVTDVVVAEIMKHLTDHTQQIISGLDTALKKARDFGVADIPMPVSGREQAREVSRQRLTEYFEALDADTISSADIKITDVLKRYFQNLPPFANPKKKAEFPDAVTLLSLENWAESNDYKILAISGDSDWAAFGEHSKRIDVVSDIGKGLNILNGQLSEARVIAGKVLDLIETGSDALLRSRFSAELETALDNLVIDSEADSYHHIEGEQVELSLREWSLLHVPSFELLASDAANEVIVVAVDAQIDVDAKADFYISVYDAGDNDYTPIGGTTARVQKQLEVKVLLTIRSHDTFEIGVVAVNNAPSFINFGEVEPDFSNDYYDPSEDWDDLERDDEVPAIKDT